MARHKVRGPNGAEVTVEVPGDMDERTFRARVAAGELTVLNEPAEPEKAAPHRPAKPRKQ